MPIRSMLSQCHAEGQVAWKGNLLWLDDLGLDRLALLAWHHAIWRDPTGSLIDISAHPLMECEHQGALFAIDPCQGYRLEWPLAKPLGFVDKGRRGCPGLIQGCLLEAALGERIGLSDEERWVETGVFDALVETLTDMVGRERSADMIDSTIVRAHHCAVGIKGGLRRPRRLADREAASLPSSTPAAMGKADRSASS